MYLIKFEENNAFSNESLIIKSDFADITMVPEVPETTTIRQAFYFNTIFNSELGTYIPVIKQLSGKELRNVYNRIRREKKTYLSKDTSIEIWRTIQALEGNWDEDLNMTKTKIKKLRKDNPDFEEHYQEVKSIPIF